MHRQYVYAISGDAIVQLFSRPLPPEFAIVRADAAHPPSSSDYEELCEIIGDPGPITREQFAAGAILYIVRADRAASILWAKPGHLVRKDWYIPLSETDLVLYGWETRPEMRGRGLIGIAIAAAARDHAQHFDRLLADVRIWNSASIRAMEKAGFQRIGEFAPLR